MDEILTKLKLPHIRGFLSVMYVYNLTCFCLLYFVVDYILNLLKGDCNLLLIHDFLSLGKIKSCDPCAGRVSLGSKTFGILFLGKMDQF